MRRDGSTETVGPLGGASNVHPGLTLSLLQIMDALHRCIVAEMLVIALKEVAIPQGRNSRADTMGRSRLRRQAFKHLL